MYAPTKETKIVECAQMYRQEMIETKNEVIYLHECVKAVIAYFEGIRMSHHNEVFEKALMHSGLWGYSTFYDYVTRLYPSCPITSREAEEILDSYRALDFQRVRTDLFMVGNYPVPA